jgi:hypothetical protein
LGAVIVAAIYTKLYGAILAITCPLYLLIHAHQFIPRAKYRTAKISLLGGVLALVVLILISAKLRLNPLLILEGGTGFGSFSSGIKLDEVGDSLLILVVAILLAFHVALLFLLYPDARRGWTVAPTLFIAIYSLGLLLFPGTSYNMRYFLPVFPFVVPVLAIGIRSAAPLTRRILLSTYGVAALLLVLNFNLAPVARGLEPLTSKIFASWPILAARLDNLRLPVHVALKSQIDTINITVPKNARLYWASDYYGITTHGLAHDLGVRNDIDVRYVLEPSDIPASQTGAYMTLFTSMVPPGKFWAPPSWATLHGLGHGLFRLDPVSIELKSLSGDFVMGAAPIELAVSVSSNSSTELGAVEVDEGNKEVHVDSQSRWSLTLPMASQGRHEYVAKARYDRSGVAVSKPVVVYVGSPAFERTVAAPRDMIDEYGDGSAIVPKEFLPLNAIERATALRFESIPVSQGEHIAEAYLQFTAFAPENMTTTLDIHAERSANAADLPPTMDSVTHRTLTTASTIWRFQPWVAAGFRDRSPNLASDLNEVFAQSGWREGNALVLIIRVSGQPRLARAADPYEMPTLYVRLR